MFILSLHFQEVTGRVMQLAVGLTRQWLNVAVLIPTEGEATHLAMLQHAGNVQHQLVCAWLDKAVRSNTLEACIAACGCLVLYEWVHHSLSRSTEQSCVSLQQAVSRLRAGSKAQFV